MFYHRTVAIISILLLISIMTSIGPLQFHKITVRMKCLEMYDANDNRTAKNLKPRPSETSLWYATAADRE